MEFFQRGDAGPNVPLEKLLLLCYQNRFIPGSMEEYSGQRSGEKPDLGILLPSQGPATAVCTAVPSAETPH